MADRKKKSEEAKLRFAREPEKSSENINSSLSGKPVAKPQEQKSATLIQNWFSRLLGREKKQELTVVNQEKLAQKEGVLPNTARDLQAGAMIAKATQQATSMMVDGVSKQENITANKSLTDKQSLTEAKNAGLSKGKTVPLAAQELQTNLKTGSKQLQQTKATSKIAAKTKESTLTSKQQLTAKQQVSKTAGLQKDATAAKTITKTTSQIQTEGKQKVARTVIKKGPAAVKTTVSKKNNPARKVEQGKTPAAKKSKQAKNKPYKMNFVVSTNQEGDVTKISMFKAFSTAQPTSRAMSRGYSPENKTSDLLRTTKRKANEKGEKTGRSIQMNR
jgi:hypothetical protein